MKGLKIMTGPVNPWQINSENTYDIYLQKSIKKRKTDEVQNSKIIVAKGVDETYTTSVLRHMKQNTAYEIELTTEISQDKVTTIISSSGELRTEFPLDLEGRITINFGFSEKGVVSEHPFGKHYKTLTEILLSYQRLVNREYDKKLWYISTYEGDLVIFVGPAVLDKKTPIQNYKRDNELVELSEKTKDLLKTIKTKFSLNFLDYDRKTLVTREIITETKILKELEEQLHKRIEKERELVTQ